MARDGNYSIFEYLYRDAGNYKTHGTVLLAGRTTPADEATVRASLDDACFVAEQVGIAPLQPQHLLNCGSESGELDHGFHEFAVLRAAEAGEANGEAARSEEHTSELQSLMRISYAVFCLKKKTR